MASVQKSVLVPYSATQMFDLVERVADYPQFLPWCAGTRVVETDAGPLVRIDINYHGVRAHFTTANRNERPERIVMELRDGPFRYLDGTWQFRALEAAGCRVELTLNYEFTTHALEKVIGPVFGHIAHSFIDAFVRRAEAVYGQGQQAQQ
jgi:ribosome-associated toxin RatA of RatAB toxin-antitoxin module